MIILFEFGLFVEYQIFVFKREAFRERKLIGFLPLYSITSLKNYVLPCSAFLMAFQHIRKLSWQQGVRDLTRRC